MNSFSAPTSAKAETDACLVKPALHLISVSQMRSLQQITSLREAEAAFVLFMEMPPRYKGNLACLAMLDSDRRILATRDFIQPLNKAKQENGQSDLDCRCESQHFLSCHVTASTLFW